MLNVGLTKTLATKIEKKGEKRSTGKYHGNVLDLCDKKLCEKERMAKCRLILCFVELSRTILEWDVVDSLGLKKINLNVINYKGCSELFLVLFPVSLSTKLSSECLVEMCPEGLCGP